MSILVWLNLNNVHFKWWVEETWCGDIPCTKEVLIVSIPTGCEVIYFYFIPAQLYLPLDSWKLFKWRVQGTKTQLSKHAMSKLWTKEYWAPTPTSTGKPSLVTVRLCKHCQYLLQMTNHHKCASWAKSFSLCGSAVLQVKNVHAIVLWLKPRVCLLELRRW